MKRLTLLATIGLALAAAPIGASPASALDRKTPVTFTADDVQYDRDGGIVTATGHVEAWQNDRTLRADKIVFDRNTGVAAATGNVVLQEPDGQVVFSDYAELTQEMKDGVLSGMRALLAQNGRLAANGARRTGGNINELSRAIYSTCNLCALDPTRAPLWDIRARMAVQDVENKRIEYRDAVIDIYGIPVMYMPYLTHPDPSQTRASGLLVPSFGMGGHVGSFAIVPYYWVLGPSSDLTLSGVVTANAGQALEGIYRQRFNDGSIKVSASASDEFGTPQGHLFARGEFALDDVWRWGFDINRASNATYVRNYRILPPVPSLSSTVYLEGFGQGSYARTDMTLYQNMTTATTSADQQPFVLPRTQYSFFGEPDALGGRLQLDAGAFNVVRSAGTSTRRANLGLDWSRPVTGPVGDLWKFGLHVDSAFYDATGLTMIPNYAVMNAADSSQTMPTASAEMRWPLARSAGADWGTQVIEPIAKLMVGPRGSSYSNTRIPNEDSLNVDFTDATLFAINRAQGFDRLEGGTRLAVGLHGNWTLPQGALLDGMIGQSYRAEKDPYFTKASGLQGTVSDIVARQTFTPASYLDITTRERFDHASLQTRFADGTVSAGTDALRLNAGYLYSTNTPYNYYDFAPTSATALAAQTTPRNEVSLGASTHQGAWRFHGTVRRDVRTDKFVSVDAGASYEDECFIFDVHYYRRYTSILADRGDSGLLFNITLKTVGEFGFHAD